eukprot:CAMPEP_0119516518 /NCGR_PEP_ID=MMETSP1344-20130328/33693_1 /TAXON_ID=236787 /ORGANISM="Florenciella parvula, Strain CCMP2471" /LENGTH=337 /DNA_ID=CAMNT_0007554025 /DNA_START=86 /DNA_END=1099 /DNA_ORIENTATION=-
MPVSLGLDMSLVEKLTFIYAPVWYDYKEKLFDNTELTYVTDYMLCVFMSYGVFSLYTKTPDSPLRTRSMALFGLYAASVLSGAVAHQTMTTLDLINSDSFKWLWCVCVGTVAAAGGVMGSIMNHLTEHRPGTTPSVLSFVPVNSVPDIVWAVWSVTLTLVVCAGGMSMERPAADIFIAGLTQAVPTAAVAMGALAYQKAGHTSVSNTTCGLLLFGFFLNSPLIVFYPLLLSTTDMSLGEINCFLHCWLAMAWGTQWWILQKYSTAYFDKTKAGGKSGDGGPKGVQVDVIDLFWALVTGLCVFFGLSHTAATLAAVRVVLFAMRFASDTTGLAKAKSM